MKFKKALATTVAASLTLSLMAGCAANDQKAENTTTGTNTATETKGQEVKNDANPYWVTEKPLELSIFFHVRNTIAYKEDWPVEQKARELTNIHLKGIAPENATDSAEVFNLMMASGELADIVTMYEQKENYNKYAMEGAFVPLNDLIDQHAPNLKAFLDEHPDVRKYMTAPDGNMYFIPYIPDGGVSKGYFIRQDWLDKLGMAVPETYEDFYNVMKAFKEEDPNGNGEKDEVPYFDRTKTNDEVMHLVTLWGGHSKPWYLDESGKVHFSAMEPEFKEGMTNIAKWYAEGLIDPEVATRGSKAREILFGDNKGGATHDWFGSTASYNDSLQEKIPEFNLQPMAPPKNVKDEQWEENSREVAKAQGWGISSINEHQVETIKYFDFWFTEEGRRLANFGIEGEQYDMVDGKPIFKEAFLNADKPVNDQLYEIGAQLPRGFWQDFSYEAQWLNPIARQGMEMYQAGEYTLPLFPEIAYTPEQQKVYDTVWPNINTYVSEMKQKWLLGAEDIETSWDQYIKTLEDMGIQQMLEVQQEAVDSYNNN